MRKLLWLPLAALALVACQTQAPGGGQNRLPTAAFSATPTSGTAPLDVTFDASASSDPDGTIASYAWAFSDGERASGRVVSHTFRTPGTFAARLTVTDNRGATATAERTITVADASGNRPPIASFSISPESGPAPLTVAFDASASTDPDGSIASYAWSFGDGGSASGVTTSHTFTSEGSFTVTLRVTDDGGLSNTATRTVTVQAGGEPGDEGADAAAATLSVASSVGTLPDLLLSGGVDFALIASQQSGSSTLVATGTVTQTGPNSFSYDAAPNDRLVVNLSDGRSFTFAFSELQGDFSGNGERFVNNPHRAAFQVSSNAAAGGLELTVQSLQLNGQRQRSVQGSLADEAGVRWVVDLTTNGSYRSDVDVPSLESEDLLQGTLSAEALGVTATLGHYYRYKQVNGVENITHQVDHGWSFGGSQYRFQLEVFVAFREAKPVDTDQWRIGGALSQDGTQIGTVQAADDPRGLSIWLQLGERRIDLFFFSYL